MIIPFVCFSCFNICATKVAQTFMMGYGNYSQSLKLLLNYISIVYSGFSKGNYLLSPFVSNTPIIYWFLFIIFLLINYHFIFKRTLESETYTKSIFMYPLIIILSTLSMMLFMCMI